MKEKPVLPPDVVQEIFRQLYFRYGADWSGKWVGVDKGEMTAAWAQGLGDLEPHEVEHALSHLPDYPPNMPTFRRIAREAPRPDRFFAAVPRPHHAPPEHVRAKLRALAGQLHADAARIMASRAQAPRSNWARNETREQTMLRRAACGTRSAA